MTEKFIVFADIGEVVPLSDIGKITASVEIKYAYELGVPKVPDDIFRLVKKGEANIVLAYMPKNISKGKKEDDSDYEVIFRRVPISMPNIAVSFIESEEFIALSEETKENVRKRMKRIMHVVKKKAAYDYEERMEANTPLVQDNQGLPTMPMAGMQSSRKEDFRVTEEDVNKYKMAFAKLQSLVQEMKTEGEDLSIREFKKVLRKAAGQSEVNDFLDVLRQTMMRIRDDVFG